MNRVYLTILTLILGWDITGQATIFSDLSGYALESEIIAKFKPKFVEVLSDANQIILRDIFNDYHNIQTFYSQTAIHLPPYEENPAHYLSMIDERSLSCEVMYIYPKSKGALTKYGNAHSDLFNLIPIRSDIIDTRRTAHYGELNESKNIKAVKSTTNNKDESDDAIKDHSRLTKYFYPQNTKDVWIEPADHLKGDIARSIFYFYTMYRRAAEESDPLYFENMRTTLCKWHNNDPTDKKERIKNRRIALYQDNKLNPFILDHTLANRLYCENHDASNQVFDFTFLKSTDDPLDIFDPRIATISDDHNKLDISNIRPSQYSLRIYAENGQKLYHIDEKLDYFNTINLWNVKPGLYFVHLFNMDTGQKYSDVFRIDK